VTDAIDNFDMQIFSQENFSDKTIDSIISINCQLKHAKHAVGVGRACCVAPKLARKMVHLHFISASTAMFRKTTHF
jgi:hypothetical protein